VVGKGGPRPSIGRGQYTLSHNILIQFDTQDKVGKAS